MDIFEEYLKKNKDNDNCIALVVKSYKNLDHSYSNDNSELSTYGDAVMKLAYCEIFLDKVENLTEEKKKYETDNFLVTNVAKRYKLLDYIKFDCNDKKIPQNYIYDKKHKFIATTVEAIIGDIFRKNKNIDEIVDLLKTWID